MSTTTLNKIIDDFTHLSIDEKEYVIEMIKKQLIEVKKRCYS
jgi:hypothetical protein